MSIAGRVWNGTPWPSGTVAERVALLDGPEPTCFAAFASLAAEADPDAELALVLQLGSVDWRRRRSAVEALGGRARAPRAVEAVVARLEDASPYVVAAACRALGAIGSVAHVDPLVRVLRSGEDDVRLAAVEALDTCAGAAAFDVLFDVLTGDPSEAVRRCAGFALNEHATAATWRTLFERWSSDPLARHRTWTCELAERFGDASCLPALAALEGDLDGHVRSASRRAVVAVRARG